MFHARSDVSNDAPKPQGTRGCLFYPREHVPRPDIETLQTKRRVLDVLANAARVKTFHQGAGCLSIRMRLFATANTSKIIPFAILASDETARCAFLAGVGGIDLHQTKYLFLRLHGQGLLKNARAHPSDETVHFFAQRALLGAEIQRLNDHRGWLPKGQSPIHRAFDFTRDPRTHLLHEIAVAFGLGQANNPRPLQAFGQLLQTIVPAPKLGIESLAEDGTLRRGHQIDHARVQAENGTIGGPLRGFGKLLAHLDVPLFLEVYQAERQGLRSVKTFRVGIGTNWQLNASPTFQCLHA